MTLDNPSIVDFPLRGEGWVAVTTPATRVPSHGVDILGQRYAYDILKLDRNTGRYHAAGWLRTLVFGVQTRECFAWGAPVHSPVDGTVVRAFGAVQERERVHPIREAIRALKNGVMFRPRRLDAILGNHVIVDAGGFFAAFVHLAPGSVSVVQGQRVNRGEILGRIGHTGNSTSPHLHFQLMDSADPLTANGIACAFAAYEVARNGGWIRVTNGIPRRDEHLRSIAATQDRGIGARPPIR